MNTVFVKRAVAGLLVAAGAMLMPQSACADMANAADECAKELLLSYFPEPIVTETLKKFNVPQDKWAGIVKSLASRDKDVVKQVEQKASAMTPNPLKDPQQRQAAVKLFRDTLLEVFTSAMKENGVTEADKYQAMLDDIQQQKAKKFAMCMEKQRQKFQQMDDAEQPQSDGTDDDEDDEDEDEDEDEDDTDEDAPSVKSEQKPAQSK